MKSKNNATQDFILSRDDCIIDKSTDDDEYTE